MEQNIDLLDDLFGFSNEILTDWFPQPMSDDTVAHESLFDDFRNQNPKENLSLQSPTIQNDSQSIYCEPLRILEQPSNNNRFRYRSDFGSAPTRKSYLKAKNLSTNYAGPTIEIPSVYRNPSEDYRILVRLSTYLRNQPETFVLHNYDFEDPANTDRYNQDLRGLVYPINTADHHNEIMTFKTLRVIKKRNADIENLPIFSLHDYSNLVNISPKDVAWEKVHLVFNVIKEIITDEGTKTMIINQSTVFSEAMSEGSEENLASGPSPDVTDSSSPESMLASCGVYRFAPKYGLCSGGDEVIVILNKRPEIRKYGEIAVEFSINAKGTNWRERVTSTVKDCAVFFTTPTFPFTLDEQIRSVDVQLSQGIRSVGRFSFHYLASPNFCFDCLNKTLGQHEAPVVRRKRAYLEALSASGTLDSHDTMVIPQASTPQMHCEPDPAPKDLVDILKQIIHCLFLNDNPEKLLRLSRSFLSREPQIIFDGLSKLDNQWILKFLSQSVLKTLKQRNQNGDSVLLHVIRINHSKAAEILFERQDLQSILDDNDFERNNIFHLLSKNKEQIDLLDLLIEKCHGKQIQLKEFMQMMNNKSETPLQVAICSNNIEAVKKLADYSPLESHSRHQETGDNLVHLAVRFGDLSMVKYLIEEKNLKRQGDEFNLQMTPEQLATSLEKLQLVDYFTQNFPNQQSQDDSATSNSDDDTD